MIRDGIKREILKVVASLIYKDGCLIKLHEAALKLRGIPLKDFPEEIKNNGLLVRGMSGAIRVTDKYLYQYTEQMLPEKSDKPEEMRNKGVLAKREVQSIPVSADDVYHFTSEIVAKEVHEAKKEIEYVVLPNGMMLEFNPNTSYDLEGERRNMLAEMGSVLNEANSIDEHSH